MQTSFKAWKWLYFYWLRHCPEDISRVGNVLNITDPTSKAKKDSWCKPQTAMRLLSLKMSKLWSLSLLCSAVAPGWSRQASWQAGCPACWVIAEIKCDLGPQGHSDTEPSLKDRFRLTLWVPPFVHSLKDTFPISSSSSLNNGYC